MLESEFVKSPMNKEQLIAEFSQYIEQWDESAADVGDTPVPDLFSLHTAMTVLQSEVKGEARLFKNALDDFRSVFQSMQQSQTHLQEALQQAKQETVSQQNTLLKPLLLEWLDLRDSLTASLQHLQSIRPQGFKARILRGRVRTIDAMLEGQRLTLRKLDHRLAQYQVIPIDAVGRPLDPEKMIAHSVISDPSLGNGVVAEELTKGFLREGKVLRHAGVCVNKI